MQLSRFFLRRAPMLVLAASAVVSATGVTAAATSTSRARPARVEVLSPGRNDSVGINGTGWIVDLRLDVPRDHLPQAGFTAPQITGPGVHSNAAPLPGAFGPGPDDRLPGLVVLVSTTTSIGPGFFGPGTNLANLFNLTGVGSREGRGHLEILDTWLVGAPIAGRGVDATLTVAVVDDLDGDGILNDAPAVVGDLNRDSTVDRRDLTMLGVASNIVSVPFHVSDRPLDERAV